MEIYGKKKTDFFLAGFIGNMYENTLDKIRDYFGAFIV